MKGPGASKLTTLLIMEAPPHRCQHLPIISNLPLEVAGTTRREEVGAYPVAEVDLPHFSINENPL
jgi:hypothetical protein